MSAPLPKGEALRRAVRWISSQREEDPQRALGPLLNDATLRFDLTPAQAEGLAAFYRGGRSESEGDDPSG